MIPDDDEQRPKPHQINIKMSRELKAAWEALDEGSRSEMVRDAIRKMVRRAAADSAGAEHDPYAKVNFEGMAETIGLKASCTTLGIIISRICWKTANA